MTPGSRRRSTWQRAGRLAIALGALAAAAPRVNAQVVACDFDVADNLGAFMSGSTLHLAGPPGGSTTIGSIVIINGNSPDTDVDKDGYATGCDFADLFVPAEFRTNLVNIENAALSIPGRNVIVSNLSRSLPSGTSARADVYVEIPPGTVAGRYVGQFQIRDNRVFAALGPNNEILNADRVFVEVTVGAQHGLEVLDPDRARGLDSLVVRTRVGQRATAVLRVGNAGNASLGDVRFSASDLRSESAVDLVIPGSNVTFAPPGLASLGVADTARITVSVGVPRGLLGGRYRGSLVVQASGAARRELPFVVVVTSARGLVFANNPVRAVTGDIGQIAFNGDPGTRYSLAIFDMNGLLVYTKADVIFAGTTGTTGTTGTGEVGDGPAAGADYAANVSWPLTNGRGEPVASGMYLVVVESIVAGRRQVAREKLMIIR